MRVNILVPVLAATASVTSIASALPVLYSENFNTDVSPSWTTLAGPDSNVATFAYDYSALGIPKATAGQSDTLGLRLQANASAAGTTAALTGLSTSPNGQSFTGDYSVRFNVWQNYGGSGSTMLTTYSIGATGTHSQRPGDTIDGVMFAISGDGGTTSDYRAYGPGNSGAQLAGVYAAGSQSNSAAYYASIFPGGATSPAVQGPSLSTPAGAPGFTWQNVEIRKVGNTATWLINGTTIATVDLTANPLGGSNISLGQSDINATGPSDPNLVFGLIDNLVVEQIVPEPTSLAALGLVGTLLRRRR